MWPWHSQNIQIHNYIYFLKSNYISLSFKLNIYYFPMQDSVQKWMVHFSSYIIQLCLFILFNIFFIFLISAQIAFIQNVGHLSQKRVPGRWDKQNFEVLLHLKDFSNGLIHVFIFRLRLEALDDKDPGISDADSENEDSAAAQSLDPAGKATTEPTLPNSQDPPGELSASQPQPTSTEALLDEEDLLIEEYDSDWLITCHGHI